MLSGGPDGGHSSELEAAIWSRDGRNKAERYIFSVPTPPIRITIPRRGGIPINKRGTAMCAG